MVSIFVLLVSLSGYFWLSDNDQEAQDPTTTPVEESTEDPASSEEDNSTQEEEQEETTDLSEDIREAFSSVLENARNIFVQNDLHITAMGDSLTQGVGDNTDNGGYVGILEDSLNQNSDTTAETVQIDNFGKRGNRTEQLLERMEKEEIQESIRQADIVLITIGANDVMKIIKDNVASLDYQQFVEAQNEYEQNLREIFIKTKELNPDAEIHLLGVYNPFDKYFNHIPELNQIVSDWNRISKEVLSEFNNTEFIPIRDIFETAEEDILWEDNFHPNEVGYKRMAERVLEYIREDIEQQ